MSKTLKLGFRLGEWEVRPLEGRLVGPEGERRLAPRAVDLLLALAAQPGQVIERDALVRAVWGERAVTDEPLTRTIADLRQALGEHGGERRFIETIPKRGYRLIAEVSDLSLASDAGATTRGADRPRRIMITAIAAVAVAALVAAWLLTTRDRSPPVARETASTRPTVVVLPFTNMSAAPADAYFSDGLTETLTHVLAQIDGLKVVARTSAFAFRDRHEDVRVIGAKLGADAILEGSVQRGAGTLRIATQLVSARDGTHLWSEAFDRSPEDVFAIQDQIAASVAAALRVALLSPGHARTRRAAYATRSVQAYDAYLHGLRKLARRTSDSIAGAIADFEFALTHDPDYALAWVGLADATILLRYYGNLPRAEMIERASAAIERAMSIDPELGEAHASIGLLNWQLTDADAAEAALRRAIALNPNYAQAYFWLGTVLNDRGAAVEALSMHRAALDLDPLSPAIHNAVGVSLEMLGQFTDALNQYRGVTEIDPGYAATLDRASRLYWSALARLDDALRLQSSALDADPGYPTSPALIAEIYLDLGDPDAAQRWIERALDIGRDAPWPHRARALLLAYSGDEPDTRLAIARRWAGAAQEAETVAILLRIGRDVLLERNDTDAALDLYRGTWPDLLSGDAAIGSRRLRVAMDLALLLTRSGQTSAADALLARAELALTGLPRLGCCGYGIADVELHALRGDTHRALTALERAVADGWRRHWWWEAERNPNLASLAGQPRFHAALATLRRETARDLQRLRIEQAD